MDKAEFLLKLAELFEQAGAGMYYTNDDDGIHIAINDEDVAWSAAGCLAIRRTSCAQRLA